MRILDVSETEQYLRDIRIYGYTGRVLVRAESLAAKAGDLVIRGSRPWHSTRQNTDGSSRWALIATFTSWWIKQNRDMTRSLPEDIYRQLTTARRPCSVSARFHLGAKVGALTPRQGMRRCGPQ